MKIRPFKVETWMNEHENEGLYNLTESCVSPLKMGELLDLLNIKEKYLDTFLDMKLDYGDINGSDELKKQICQLYDTVEPCNIAIAQGAINANEMAIMELIEPNDEIITFTPGYQQISSLAESLGANIIELKLYEDKGWQMDFDELERVITEKTKAICVTLPNNPTGTMLSGEQAVQLVELAEKYDLYLFVDEVYRGLCVDDFCYQGSFYGLYDKAIITSGLSKAYGLPALRLGWIIGPKDFIDRIINRRDYHIISIPKMNDLLAVEVLKQKEKVLSRNYDICMKNRAFLKEWIKEEKHITNTFTSGTTQLIRYDMKIPSEELSLRVQKEEGIFFVPGSCFDCEYHLRLGGGIDPIIFQKGLKTFSKWLRQFDDI